MIQLRPYQLDAIQQTRDRILAGRKAPLLVAPTGAGKTVIEAAIVLKHLEMSPDNRVLIVAHRRELIEQIANTLRKFGINNIGLISPNHTYRPTALAQVASVQTLRARNLLPPASLVMFDECVTGDAEVGGKRADEIKVGDWVDSWNEKSIVRRRVTHVFVNKASSLLVLRVGEKSITCTGSHPVWVKGKGFINADEVQAGDLCCVRRENKYIRALKNTEKDLLSRMLESHARDDDGKDEPQVCLAKNEGAQPNAQKGSSREDGEYSSKDWACSQSEGGKRAANVGTSKDFARFTGKGLDFRANSVQQVDPSKVGDRYREHETKDCNRGRRVQSCRVEDSIERPREGHLFDFARVDSVEVLECGSDGSFGGRAPQGTVYNFEVEGEHNFFANGILTHNCHHYSSDDWHELTKAYPNVLRLGFTATPCRSDGRGMAPAFDSLVIVSTVKELTAQGHLVPCKVIAPAVPLKRPAMSHSPVDAYLAHANGARTVVFADFIVNAERFVEEFREKGVHAVIVHGKLSDAERKEAFAEHAKGAVLVNCMVLTEGWDSPETSCCILARGCGSLGTYLQIVGRVLRPSPGKTQAILIDLTGRSFYQHGPPDEDRIYSLEGKGIRSKQDGEQVYCPVCGQPVEAPPDSWPCGMCGHNPGGPVTEAPRYTGDELAERYALKREEDNGQRVETLSRWFAEVRAKGHKEWSAIAKYKAVYGVAPSDTIKQSALRKSRDLSCAKCIRCSKIVARTYAGGQCGTCAFEKKGAA